MDNIRWGHDDQLEESAARVQLKDLAPSDFIFYSYFNKYEQAVCLIITPLKYWLAEKAMYDNHLGHIVDKWLTFIEAHEELESEWIVISGENADEVRRKMIQAGFVQNTEFDNFLKNMC